MDFAGNPAGKAFGGFSPVWGAQVVARFWLLASGLAPGGFKTPSSK
jgi:hypothetical protein